MRMVILTQPLLMSRRSFSSSSPPRDIKRPRIAGLTPDDYRNGLMLAPMVRSGARTLPQLFDKSLFLSGSHIFSSHKTFRSETWRKTSLGS